MTSTAEPGRTPTMRAVVTSEGGQGPVGMARVAIPRNASDELLVRIEAIGVGIHDSYFLPAVITDPYPIGIEAAGVVEQVGDELAERYRPGDRIAFVSVHQPKGGTWAQYAVVGGDSLIVPVPPGMDFEHAAAVPVAGGTILRALRTLPPIPEGGSIFIAGASGAIGTLVVQMARARGWRVAGSASPHNHDYLAALGVDKVVDYHDPSWPEQVLAWSPSGVDAALAVQPSTTADTLRVVKDGGAVVTISGDQVEPQRDVTVVFPAHDVDVRAELSELIALIIAGGLLLELEQVYPFDDALAALAKVQTRHARGKVVISVR